MKGKFIVIEGIDGSGKTTQTRKLRRYLQGKSIPCYGTYEPRESIRYSLMEKLSVDQQALLFCADRLKHCLDINSYLDEGFWVVCDRFSPSTLVYQRSGENMDWLLRIDSVATNGLTPDLTILLKVPLEVALLREENSSANHWKEKLEEIQEIYPRACRLTTHKYKEIDCGDRNIDSIAQEIQAIVSEEFGI